MLRKVKLLKVVQVLLGNYFLKASQVFFFFFNSGDQITRLNFTFHNDEMNFCSGATGLCEENSQRPR